MVKYAQNGDFEFTNYVHEKAKIFKCSLSITSYLQIFVFFYRKKFLLLLDHHHLFSWSYSRLALYLITALRWRMRSDTLVQPYRKFSIVSCSEPARSMSCLCRRPRLRRLCLTAVNLFQFALVIWLDRLVLAGADGRSSPEAPWCSGSPMIRGVVEPGHTGAPPWYFSVGIAQNFLLFLTNLVTFRVLLQLVN